MVGGWSQVGADSPVYRSQDVDQVSAAAPHGTWSQTPGNPFYGVHEGIYEHHEGRSDGGPHDPHVEVEVPAKIFFKELLTKFLMVESVKEIK